MRRRMMQHAIWVFSLLIMAIILWWQPQTNSEEAEQAFRLPAEPPDLYIEMLQQASFDSRGEPRMRLRADSLAFYEEGGLSHIEQPRLNRIIDREVVWSVQSLTAILFNSGDVEFSENVNIQEENVDQPWLLETDWLRLEQEGSFATTPSPVKLTQGNQRATGTGMDALLVDANPELTLKSEVTIRYEMDAN